MSEILRRPALEPDAGRTDWGMHGETLAALLATVQAEVLAPLDAAVAELEGDAEQIGKVRAVVADRVGDAAGLLLAAGRHDEARRLIHGALAVARTGPAADLLAAGLADPARFVQVIRAWWLVHQKRRDEAVTVARATAKGAPSAITDAVQAILDAPRPIDSPPTLFGINGFGLRVYGERDRRPDGSYVTTRYITGLFIPLLPVDAYRVAPAGGEGWYFLGKESLAPLHRWWQRLALLGLVVAVLGGIIGSYLSSEGRRLAQAIEAAQEAEAVAGPDGRAAVLDQYEAILTEFPEADPPALVPVIEAFVRLGAADVASPLTVEHVAEVKRLALRYRSLPDVARNQQLVAPMVAQLERWAEELGTDGHGQILAAIEIYGYADALASPSDKRRIQGRRNALNRQLAAELAAEWPLEAFRQYAAMLDDPESVTAAGALLESLDDGPSVWIELAPTIERWQPAASREPKLAATREKVTARVLAARERMEDAERVALLAQPELEALTAAVAASPGDQELAVALADLKLATGDAEGALAVLTALGPPGRMVLAAQAALASSYAEAGREAEADALLERVLTSRLPAFESAQRVYGERADALSERLIARAQQGNLPRDIMTKLDRAPEAKQGEIFREWLDAEVDKDAELSRLRDEYVALTGVVGLAIQSGTIKLRRANAVEGPARQELLDGAERAFLAIGREGSGIPSYHLGLGQVYYRLGKEEEGERELQNLLDDDPPEVQLAVAHTYRELGLMARARAVAEQVFASAESPVKESAAVLMAMIVTDREESRTWLQRGDQSQPSVRLRLLELDAHEQLAAGNYAAADAKFADVATGWVEQARHDSAAANNGALAMLSRYSCTGDAERLREAVQLLEKARSLAPDNALVVGNLGAAVEMLASVELLERWLQPELLRLSMSEIEDLLGALITGPHRAQLQEQLGASQTLRRALDLMQQDRILGPKNPEPYQSLLLWHARRNDAKALAELRRTVTEIEVDLSAAATAAAAALDGRQDASAMEELEQRLARYDGVEAVVNARGHRPTQAALKWLRGETQLALALLRRDAGMAREAAATHASAQARWDGLDVEEHARALVELALLEAMQGSSALADAYAERRRRLGTEGLMAWLIEDDGDALAALVARPELAEAVALRRGVDSARLRSFDWLLARLASDEPLLAASRQSIERPEVRVRFEIGMKLSPQPEGSELVLRLMDAAAAR